MLTDSRKADLRLTETQRLIVRATTVAVRAIHRIRRAQKDEDTELLEPALKLLTHSMALLGTSSQDLSMKQRAAIKPCLNPNVNGI